MFCVFLSKIYSRCEIRKKIPVPAILGKIVQRMMDSEELIKLCGWSIEDIENALTPIKKPIIDLTPDTPYQKENVHNGTCMEGDIRQLENDLNSRLRLDVKEKTLDRQRENPVYSQFSKGSEGDDIKLENLNLDTPLPNGWTLFQHQKEAIREGIRLERIVLAYDMGLGKTCIGLIWAKNMCKSRISCITVVTCPCTLIETWRREAIMLGFKESTVKGLVASSRSRDGSGMFVLSSSRALI